MSKKNIKSEGGFVFSTNPNFNIENENEAAETLPPNEQKLKVWLEKNHRGGKTASVIKDFKGNEEDLEQMRYRGKCERWRDHYSRRPQRKDY